MARVDVNPEMLKWAFHRSTRPKVQLEKRFPKAKSWFEGSLMPTFKQLENFAAFTYTPLGYFFLESPPEEELQIPFYRTTGLEENPDLSINLVETIEVMQYRQEWMRDYLQDEGMDPLGFVGSLSVDDPSILAASKIREVLGLPTNWAMAYDTWRDALKGLQAVFESIGIVVITNGVVRNNTHRKLDPNEFRGFVLVDDYAPLLFVNGADSKAAQMFTLVHELAHVFLGQSAIFDLRDSLPAKEKIERKCDEIAAEFLVPAKDFRLAWETMAPYGFQELARQFKVSEIVIARRALDLAFIDKAAFLEFYKGYQERIKKTKTDGGNYWYNQRNRVGRLFGERVITAAKEGALLFSEAYRLTDLYGSAFDNFAAFIRCEV